MDTVQGNQNFSCQLIDDLNNFVEVENKCFYRTCTDASVGC